MTFHLINKFTTPLVRESPSDPRPFGQHHRDWRRRGWFPRHTSPSSRLSSR